MRGRIYQINRGEGGVPKHPMDRVLFTKNGLEADDHNDKKHHGGEDKAVCLYSLENLARLKEQGFPVFPGALGENITTNKVDHNKIRIGDIFTLGRQVRIKITDLRTPCGTIQIYGDIVGAIWNQNIKNRDYQDPLWGMTGFYAAVIEEGVAWQNEIIERV